MVNMKRSFSRTRTARAGSEKGVATLLGRGDVPNVGARAGSNIRSGKPAADLRVLMRRNLHACGQGGAPARLPSLLSNNLFCAHRQPPLPGADAIKPRAAAAGSSIGV